MKFKKVLLVTLFLLAVLTIGAVSAADDVDALAADDSGDEEVIETPVEDNLVEADENADALGDPNPEDFNVTISNQVDIDDASATAVSWDWPSEVASSGYVKVDVEGGFAPTFDKGTATSKKVTIDDLYIFDTGVYNISVYYGDNTLLKKGTLNVIKSSFTADDFIELYSTQEMGEPVSSPESYICTARDSYSGIGLDGVVTVYANGNPIYTKTFKGNGKIAYSIWGKNLTGTFNGEYLIKVVYKRSADGKTYSKEKKITFTNVAGKGEGSDPISNNGNGNSKKADEIKLSLAKAKVKKSAKKLFIRATLKINGKAKKGLKVKFKFNKKSYSAKTDKKGVAKVTIPKKVLKKLKVGKKVTYTAQYSTKTAKQTVKVKK
jgi:hypothetical protein